MMIIDILLGRNYMPTIVDKEKFQALTILAKKSHVSRASLIREAVNNFIESSSTQQKTKDVFGLLKKHEKIDALTFQKKCVLNGENESTF